MNPDQYYRALLRQPHVTTTTRFAVIPAHLLSDEKIAFDKGLKARGTREPNPYPPQTPLADHWNRGYSAQP